MQKFKRICSKCNSKNTKKEEWKNPININLVVMFGLIKLKKVILNK